MKRLIMITLAGTILQAGAANLAVGGQFKDRILPMQGTQQKAEGETIWGAEGVQQRFIDNGAESESISFWGGDIHRSADGKYYMFVAGWDATTRAHSYWPNSDIYHVEADHISGPYRVAGNIGTGHNPSLFIAKDGTHVIYTLIGNSSAWRYTASSPAGPWTFESMPLDRRNRALSTGSTTTYSNWTFATRHDGSIYCLDRGGAIWVSEDGIKPFEEIYGKSCYPNGGGGSFEDPVVWKDEFQYHMIVNDWRARIAYYSRSKDGYNWVHEDGTAYDPTVAVHPDGTREEWFKFERPRVFQDEYGRATQLNMAVIDVEKSEDKAGDEHSSKNIVMPLNPGLRMEVLNQEPIGTSTAEIKVRILREEGFNPATDLDLSSLRFGKYSVVNAGNGATAVSSQTDADGNLIVTFCGADTGIEADEFAPKLLGRYAAGYANPATPTATPGAMCFGYARLPYVDYTPAYISPNIPEFGETGEPISISVKNYGLKRSEKVDVKVLAGSTLLASGSAPALDPYQASDIRLNGVAPVPTGTKDIVVEILSGEKMISTHTLALEQINAAQAKLLNLINEANELIEKASFKYGKPELQAVIDACKTSATSFYEPAINEATAALLKAINNFKFANATAKRPVAITISDPDFKSTAGWDILHEGPDGDFHINANNKYNYNLIGSTEFLEAYNMSGITKPNHVRQSISGLPAGRYSFEIDVIAQYKNGGSEGVSAFCGDNSTACSSKTAGHSEHYSVECTLDSEGSILFGIEVDENSNATWVAMDNAELLYYGDGTHDDEEIPADVTIKHYNIKAANYTINNIYVYADMAGGRLKRCATMPGEEGVFTLISDNENKRTYLYNHICKSFVKPKAGSGSEWELTQTQATCIGGLLPATTCAGAYVVKGEPDSSDKNNYMNAHKGFNYADRDMIASYISGDKGSEWLFLETSGLTDFSTDLITSGKEEFIETLRLIPGISIDGEATTTGLDKLTGAADRYPVRYYTMQGFETDSNHKGMTIVIYSDNTAEKLLIR